MEIIIKDRVSFFKFNEIYIPIEYFETWNIEEEGFDINFLTITETSPLEEKSNFYDNFKDLKTKDLPEGVLFEFWKNIINSKKPEILDKVSLPFKMFSFVRIKNRLVTRFSFTIDEYRDIPERWNRKTSIEYFIKNLTEKVEDSENIDLFEHDNFLILQFISDDIKPNIHQINEKLFTELEFLVQKVETEILGLKRFDAFLEQWNQHKDSSNEKKWQQIIKNNSWIISQLFSAPLILLEDEAFLGGKNIQNKKGNIIDFVYQNKLNSNILLIEIKTPKTKLIGRPYRSTYQISNELSGSVNQVLNYKQSLMNEFHTINSNSDNKLEATNPKSILIIGKISDLTSSQKKAFELFRNELRTIQIITFDELYEKTNILIKLLKN
jgi:hypothetical protein